MRHERRSAACPPRRIACAGRCACSSRSSSCWRPAGTGRRRPARPGRRGLPPGRADRHRRRGPAPRRRGRPRADRRPSAAEKQEEIASTVPRRTALRGVRVAGGVATIDLARRFAAARGRGPRRAGRAARAHGDRGFRRRVGPAPDRRRDPLGLFPGYATSSQSPRPTSATRTSPRPRSRRAGREGPERIGPRAPGPARRPRLPAARGVDGQSGEQTRFAVMAFQKWARPRSRRRRRPAHARGAREGEAADPRTKGSGAPRRGPARPPARALHRRRPRRPDAARLHRRARFRDADRPLQRLPEGAQLVVGALQGLAAVGELLRRRRRLPRVARRAGAARLRTAACASRATTRSGSTTGCPNGTPVTVLATSDEARAVAIARRCSRSPRRPRPRRRRRRRRRQLVVGVSMPPPASRSAPYAVARCSSPRATRSTSRARSPRARPSPPCASSRRIASRLLPAGPKD